MNLKNTIILLISTLLLFFVEKAYSQNEPFHGGSGDGFGYTNSSALNMEDVGFVGNNLTVTINQADTQEDPTDQESIIFQAVFSENVTDFDPEDVVVLGGTNPQNINISGSGTNYNISISGVMNNGDIILEIPAGGVHNSVGNPNQNSTSTDNSVTFFGANLLVFINLASDQSYYSNKSTVHFSVTFSENVYEFSSADVDFSGSAYPTNISITGSGMEYDLAVSGMTTDGNVIVNIPEDRVFNTFGKGNSPSINNGNTIVIDYTKPNVEITQETGQEDPSITLPLNFHIEFNEAVQDFYADKISFGASSGVYIELTGSGTSYTVFVYGLQTGETIHIYVPENSAHDRAGNYNTESLNTDNSITYNGLTSIYQVENKDFSVFYSEGYIYVNFNELPLKSSTIAIYDMSGRLILNKTNLNQSSQFAVNKSKSAYLVRIFNGKSMHNMIILPFNFR